MVGNLDSFCDIRPHIDCCYCNFGYPVAIEYLSVPLLEVVSRLRMVLKFVLVDANVVVVIAILVETVVKVSAIGSFVGLLVVPGNVFAPCGKFSRVVVWDLEGKLRYRSRVCVSFQFEFDFDKRVVRLPFLWGPWSQGPWF